MIDNFTWTLFYTFTDFWVEFFKFKLLKKIYIFMLESWVGRLIYTCDFVFENAFTTEYAFVLNCMIIKLWSKISSRYLEKLKAP